MKSTVGSMVAISFGLAISAYASMSRLSIERESFEGGVRGPSDETARYVTVDLPYDPFRRLTESLETLEGIKLKTRGEAHITLITQPEFDVLSKHLAESEIRHAFDAVALRPAEPICVGRGHVGAAKTYYVVVKLASALKVRELLVRSTLTFDQKTDPLSIPSPRGLSERALATRVMGRALGGPRRQESPAIVRPIFAALHDQVEFPDIKAARAALAGDGELRPSLEKLAAEVAPGLVKFLGFRNQTELPAFYDLCDLFVLPSVFEPWGLVVNEVMNAAKPVIVSDKIGSGHDLVQPGINGDVFPAGDVEALAAKMRPWLLDAALRARGGAESLRLINHWSFKENLAGMRQAVEALQHPAFHA